MHSWSSRSFNVHFQALSWSDIALRKSFWAVYSYWWRSQNRRSADCVVSHQRIEISFQNMLWFVQCLKDSIKSLDIKFKDQDHRCKATDILNQTSVTFYVRARPKNEYSHEFFNFFFKRFDFTQCFKFFAATSVKLIDTVCTWEKMLMSDMKNKSIHWVFNAKEMWRNVLCTKISFHWKCDACSKHVWRISKILNSQVFFSVFNMKSLYNVYDVSHKLQ